MNSNTDTELVLNTDGGSRNNPGNAAIGFVILNTDGDVIETQKKYIGIATNNEAEYQALLSGLQYISNFYLNCKFLTIYADSELMVKQLRGEYKIREQHLKVFAESIHTMLKKFSEYKIIHVLRDKNKLADKLVNEALDELG
ncbi:ribonuclease HI family protein [bacterium]|nr:ribonuclease HI family protein [bacterium]